MVYSWMIIHDKDIPGTVVRSSTIPEELGRIGYLLSDKTGTLTENEMVRGTFNFRRYPNVIKDALSLIAVVLASDNEFVRVRPFFWGREGAAGRIYFQLI